MPGATALCPVSRLRSHRSLGFDLPQCPLFLVMLDCGDIRAYRNNCPHWDIGLNWRPDVFLDYDQCYIQCKTHGALFRKEDGFCIVGPCNGDSLSPLDVFQSDGWIYLAARFTGNGSAS